MTPLLHPFLVNGRFGDPALYVEVKFERRAVLFDLGNLHALEPRRILRLTDIFVSHRHMDHFADFDRILRILLGREKTLRLYGPQGIIEAVERRLGSYSWNLVGRYATDLVLVVTEMLSPVAARRACFRLKSAFARTGNGDLELAEGVLYADESFRVRADILDHRIPCLAFAIEETAHVNVWKSRLDARGLAVGPWLRDLKQAVLRGDADETPVSVRWAGADEGRPPTLPLSRLKAEVLRIVSGQKIAYVTDAAHTRANARRIVELARDADILFIEAPFAEVDADLAADRAHLTTAQAGALARRAGVRRLEPFHFSARYEGAEARLLAEVEAAFRGAEMAAGGAAGPCRRVPE